MTNPPLGGKTNLVTAPNTGLQRPLEWLPRCLAWGVNRLLILAATATLVAGCAVPQRNEVFAPVQQLVREQLGADLYWATNDSDRAIIEQRVRELLSKPLCRSACVIESPWLASRLSGAWHCSGGPGERGSIAEPWARHRT